MAWRATRWRMMGRRGVVAISRWGCRRGLTGSGLCSHLLSLASLTCGILCAFCDALLRCHVVATFSLAGRIALSCELGLGGALTLSPIAFGFCCARLAFFWREGAATGAC